MICYIFIDMNECKDSSAICGASGSCTNTVGSFTCLCNSGYSGDGVICTGNLFDIFYFCCYK